MQEIELSDLTMSTRLDKLKIYKLQEKFLFLTIVLFPFSLLAFNKSFLNVFSFWGQLSSVPILIGLLFFVFSCFLQASEKKLLFSFAIFAGIYLFLLACISIHSLIEYAQVGAFDSTSFGGTPKILLLKSFFGAMGISNDTVLYSCLVFAKDMLFGTKEIVYAFGFMVWIAFMYLEDSESVVRIVFKAILIDIFLLAPYIVLELLHLYGAFEGGATTLLKSINAFLYAPGEAPAFYPPIVSPNQVRGTWMEPAYLAMWLSFATPFLILNFFKDGIPSKGKSILLGVFFTALWSVWFVTYSRTAIALIVVLMALYFFFAILSHRRKDWERLAYLLVTLLFAFAIVSNFGPAEFSKRSIIASQTTETGKEATRLIESELFRNTVESTVNAESRSNPVRLDYIKCQWEIFKAHPILGVGDTLAAPAVIQQFKKFQKPLTWEAQLQVSFTEENGYFKSIVNSYPGSIAGCLSHRGLLGFATMVGPLLVLGLLLFKHILKTVPSNRELPICVFISCASLFLTSLTFSSLSSFRIWCVAGIALGIVLSAQRKKEGLR